MQDSFKARRKLEAGGRSYEYFALDAIAEPNVGRLPYSLKILLENLLRHEDGQQRHARRHPGACQGRSRGSSRSARSPSRRRA